MCVFISCNKEFGYVHLSAGDLLRAERKKPGSKVGQLIEDHIVAGTIVPVEITCSLLENVCPYSFNIIIYMYYFKYL